MYDRAEMVSRYQRRTVIVSYTLNQIWQNYFIVSKKSKIGLYLTRK